MKLEKLVLKIHRLRQCLSLKRTGVRQKFVLIRRTTKEDLIQDKSFFNNVIFEDNPINQVAPQIYNDAATHMLADLKTHNWWRINEGKNIGYFSASLLSNLTYANKVG